MRSLLIILISALVGMCVAQPVAQQQTAAAAPGQQGEQRIFGNLLGAAQGAVQGFFNPGGYNQYGGGYNQFGGGYNQFGGGYNQFGGGYNPYGGYGGGYGGGYNQYWG
ncbi:unnamed protein product [Meganyctiphanes norvegica]|uniref:Uncharacterized protein n=1 Tax=Meganyctiphanes norvegica TaxID=48144 RepID=A0AAV2RCU1_MEGNR